MKRFISKLLFHVGISVTCIAFIASGLVYAQAPNKKNGRGNPPARESIAPQVAGALSDHQKPNVDMNGDGRTDFVITRPVGSAALSSAAYAGSRDPRKRRSRILRQYEQSMSKQNLAGDTTPAEWWVKYNNAPGGITRSWGLFFEDRMISADFDGDGSADFAVWRPGDPGQAAFYSLNSSDNTFRFADFGQFFDDPAVVGDYDGDGLDDPAVFRCPIGGPDSQCYYFYRGSLNNPSGGITYVPWGFGNFFGWVPYPGDFDGDGKYDFCVQDIRTDPQASFWLKINGSQSHEVISWGLTTDLLIPGDFDGDGKSDFTVRRLEDDDRYTFYTKFRAGGVRIVSWGMLGDIEVPGDYDGDGTTDIAIYRWGNIGATFWIKPSNGDPHLTYNWGVPGDEPLANWFVQ